MNGYNATFATERIQNLRHMEPCPQALSLCSRPVHTFQSHMQGVREEVGLCKYYNRAHACPITREGSAMSSMGICIYNLKYSCIALHCVLILCLQCIITEFHV